MAVVALDLGGTKLAAGLITDRGRLLAQRGMALGERQGLVVGDLLGDLALEMASEARNRTLTLSGVGISAPGIADDKGQVWAPNIRGWDWFPLRTHVEQRLKAGRERATRPHPKVFIESDRTCYILGECWKGAARGCRDAVFISVGTGIAAGILTGGRVLKGAHGIAGSIGWLGLDRPFRSSYVNCGCLEWHASGAGLAKVAWSFGIRRRPGQGVRNAAASIAAPEIFTRWRKGDPLAGRVMREAVQYWGMAAANLVSIFNPELVVFGGGVFGPALRLLPAIAREARRWAQPVAMGRVRFVGSRLAGDAGLYGAAYLALHRGKID